RGCLAVATPAAGGFGERVRDGFGDERLPATRGPVQEQSLGRFEAVFAVEIGVQEGQFNGVADLFDLVTQTADIGVADVGDLFEHEFFHLGAVDLLVGEARAGVGGEVIPDAHGVGL